MSRAGTFLLCVFFALLLASCFGRGVEVPQSFFDPRPPAEWVFMNGKVVTIQPDAPLAVAAQSMLENRVGALPVVDDQDQLIGIVTESDLLRHLAHTL